MPSHNVEKNVAIPFQMVCATVDIPVQSVEKNCEIDVHAALAVCLIPSHSPAKNSFTAFQIFIQAALISSQWATSNFPTAITATITAIIASIGAPTLAMTGINAEMAGAITPTRLITALIPVAIFPMMINTGPTAATTMAMITIIFFVPSDSPENQEVNACILSASAIKIGASTLIMAEPNSMAVFFNWLNAFCIV